MEPAKKTKPFPVFLLYILICMTGVSAIYGGLSLVIDPSGNQMHLQVNLLAHSYFKDYLIPGVILLILIGGFSMITLAGLVEKFQWKVLNSLNIFKDQEWAWGFTLYLGIILTIWIEVQLMMIGYQLFIQILIAATGILMIVIPLIPSVKNHFQIPIEKRLYKNILKEYKTAIKFKDLVS